MTKNIFFLFFYTKSCTKCKKVKWKNIFLCGAKNYFIVFSEEKMTFRKSDRKYRKAEPERKTDHLKKFSVTNSICSKNINIKNQLFFGEVGGVLKCLHHPTPPVQGKLLVVSFKRSILANNR